MQNPYEVANAIFNDIKSTQQQKTRNLLRLIPVSCTCQASLDRIKESIVCELDAYLLSHPDSADNSKYTILFKARNNNQLSRTVILPSLVSSIGEKLPKLQADYKDPVLFVLVNVLQTKCCISVVNDYTKFCRYNLIELAGKAVNNKDDET